MRIVALYLIDRLRHTRSRAEELLRLRRELRSVQLAAPSEPERVIALEMRELRRRIASATGQPQCCRTCARNHPLPNGQWEGGYCCGTSTWKVFTPEEIVAVAASGTCGTSLVSPRSAHAGCVFRGPTGCSIEPEDRPNICLRYLCIPLVTELRERGDLKSIDGLCNKLAATFRRFQELRAARIEQESLEELQRDLQDRGKGSSQGRPPHGR